MGAGLWERTLCLALAISSSAEVEAQEKRLQFEVREGKNLNSFLREGHVAAHLVLRSGTDPRVLVVFPAGNSGVGLWFEHLQRSVTWTVLEQPRAVVENDGKGRALYGISVKVGLADAEGLKVKQAILSSVRVLRDYQSDEKAPREVLIEPSVVGNTATWLRDRLDGAAGYRLRVEVTRGKLSHSEISADHGIEATVTALSGETPLTPLPEDQLLNARAGKDQAARNTLTFLSYREKFLAGSWRFDTYFGRDTLMSLGLLMPALTPEAVKAGLGSVLARLSPQGEVAHEEDIGEFAILDERAGKPTLNYNMIDANYMLAPIAAMSGRTIASKDLVSNFRLVVKSAMAFARDPQVNNLIGLKPGQAAGEWRDSENGLGGGRYPYDVNAILVPAALQAVGKIYASKVLDPYVNQDDRKLFEQAASLALVWKQKAPGIFEVKVPRAQATSAIESYAKELGVAKVDLKEDVKFHALALRADGTPVPVVNSDEGFNLLLGHPDANALNEALGTIMKPFPAGLMTDVGMLVANPVFAPRDLRERFSNRAYHGTVVWSWQQALMAAGLERQLQRKDLPESTLDRLRQAHKQLWHVIDAGKAVRNSELWSWSYEGGHYRVAPFGVSDADVDESNAAQLWSTVYLAVQP
jgi:hypothetical protein